MYCKNDRCFNEKPCLQHPGEFESCVLIKNQNLIHGHASIELVLIGATLSGNLELPFKNMNDDDSKLTKNPKCLHCFQYNKTTYLNLNCGHDYCADCLTLFVKTKIKDGKYEILCPLKGCLYKIQSRTIEYCLNLDSQCFEKYQILKKEHANKIEFRICNECNSRCTFDAGVNKLVHCDQCDIDFCRVCKMQNCDGSFLCINEIEKECNEIQEAFEDQEEKEVKKCPCCLITLWKEYGCNAVRCPYCKVQFCWQCLLVESKLKQLYYHECSNFIGYLDSDSDYLFID